MNLVADIRAHATARPDAPALIVQGRDPDVSTCLGYGELLARVEEQAAQLRAAGITAGDRVGLVARNGAAFVAFALGVLEAGACLVPIPDDHRGAVLEDFAARAGLRALAVEADDLALTLRPNAALPGLDEAAFRALDPAYLRFTSGTTSARKGVILGHASIRARLEAANRALAIGPADRILWLLPMAHHLVVSIFLYLREGAAVLLPESALAAGVLALGEREKATVLYASPYHFNLLAKDAGERQLADLRLAISTAEGLRAPIAERFRARFGHPVSQALGIIEVGLPALNLARAAEKPEALGQPLPDYEVWLRGEDGAPVTGPGSPEQTGEVCIRGPGLLDAYLAPWTPRAQVVEPDGFRTGDQGWFDADGDLHLAGRRHNRINMAGMKFFCEEVEQWLDEHPGVFESRVFAQEHAHLGEIPVAEFVPADAAAPPSSAELSRYLRGHLATYKVPRRFAAVEALPRTATGKVRRTS